MTRIGRRPLAAYVPPVRHGGALGLGWSPVPGRVDIVARYCDGVRTLYCDIPLAVARRYVRRFRGTHD